MKTASTSRSFSRSSALLLALCALPLAACADGDDADPVITDPTAPIATIALANGNQVEFYEPSPGRLFVSELGTAGVTPLPTSNKSAVELYRQLRPDQKVPAVLLAAQARQEAMPPGPAPTLEAAATELPGAGIVQPGTHDYIDNEGCDDHWFNDTFCGGTFDWKMCLLNHWNGAFASLSSVDYVHHAACADIGDITFKVRMGDGSGINSTVLQGQYRTYSWKDDCVFGCNESTRGDILNATDNRFHYSVRANF